ncbi:MAG: WD40 repeat domain-containing protein [Treponema sp.]|nr:WD40 repeat domain-containing protein [Treponema sp.]
MAQERKKLRIVIVFFLFVVYFVIAARPIPREVVLTPVWISSPETEQLIPINSMEQASPHMFPFTLGNRFGYVDSDGNFLINKIKTGDIYLSKNQWTEYEAEPAILEIKNAYEETAITIENPGGYPVLLDDRVFILGSEQNSLSEIDAGGSVLWTYDFAAPITCIDAAAGLVLTGSLDGVMEIIDSNGKRIFFFEPGGSRYAVILGCAISRDGLLAGIVSGIENQRFLMFERYNSMSSEYKVVHHEFMETSLRRPVHISFIDQDRRVVFENAEGIGCYEIKFRQTMQIPLDGEIAVIDSSGDQGLFFLICSYPDDRKELIGVKFPQDSWIPFSGFGWDIQNKVFLKAPFKSERFFLGRTGQTLVAGGGTALVSFELENK